MAQPKIKLDVKLLGRAVLERKLKLLDVRARGILRGIVNDRSREIVNKAKKETPVDMGLLRASLKPTFYSSGLTARVGTDLGYAAFVEFGTGPLGRRTGRGMPTKYRHGQGGKFPPPDVLTDWVWRNRKKLGGGSPIRSRVDAQRVGFLIGRRIAKHGVRAKPFLLPAFEEVKPKFNRDVRSKLRSLGRKA